MKVIERSDLRAFSQVRLITGDGVNQIVSIMDAWKLAEEQTLDLVLVSDEKAIPPVVRIQDFKKLAYEKKKAKAKQVKGRSDLKEIQLKANISDHDLQTKINNIDKFLERGDKVKVVVRLKGRERDNPQRAQELLSKVTTMIKTVAKANYVPGPIATVMLEPGATK